MEDYRQMMLDQIGEDVAPEAVRKGFEAEYDALVRRNKKLQQDRSVLKEYEGNFSQHLKQIDDEMNSIKTQQEMLYRFIRIIRSVKYVETKTDYEYTEYNKGIKTYTSTGTADNLIDNEVIQCQDSAKEK